MGQDRKLTEKRLSELWADDDIEVVDVQGKSYVIISDMHFGDGGDADDFSANERVLIKALEHYYDRGFTLVLLGDIEELWQFDLDSITQRYDASVYQAIRKFGDRVIRVHGNHDLDWRRLPDPVNPSETMPLGAPEALKMKCQNNNAQILLIHGHQGSTESDKSSWASRYWVRVFKKVEATAKWMGFYGHSSATKSRIAKDYERILYGWAKKNKVILICGHSHRAIFAAKAYVDILRDEMAVLQQEILDNRDDSKLINRNLKKLRKIHEKLMEEELKERDIDPTDDNFPPLPCYFNTGCGLYTDGITMLEIDKGQIRLMKWHQDITQDPPRVEYGTGDLETFCKSIARNE